MINLDRRILMHKKTVSIDGFGGQVETFQDVPMSASISFATGREDEDSGIVYADNKINVIVHYRDWINTTLTFSFKGKKYDIESVGELMRNQYTKIIGIAHE